MDDLEQYLFKGLRKGYNQNQILHTSFIDNKSSIVEYLLTVNVAQQLIDWNERYDNTYSLYLEYPTELFFKNAFLPFMDVGNDIFNKNTIQPKVLKSLNEKEEIRTGKIDLVVSKGKIGYGDFKESVIGIELKRINPNLTKVLEDIKRLVIAIELEDEDFNNSIQSGYCIFIKRLGGNRRPSREQALEKAMRKSIKHITTKIKANIKTTKAKINIHNELIDIKTLEYFKAQNREDLSSDEVAEETKVVFSVLVRISR
jgi:hypothetical protein